MTTVAYRDGLVAVDRRMLDAYGTVVTDDVDKYFFLRKTGTLVVVVGNIHLAPSFVSWLENGGPRPQLSTGSSAGGLTAVEFFEKDGEVVIAIHTEDGPAFLKSPPFMAWGSGRDAAMAAMHAGKTAADSVKIASLVNVYTGSNVSVLEVPVIGEQKRG